MKLKINLFKAAAFAAALSSFGIAQAAWFSANCEINLSTASLKSLGITVAVKQDGKSFTEKETIGNATVTANSLSKTIGTDPNTLAFLITAKSGGTANNGGFVRVANKWDWTITFTNSSKNDQNFDLNWSVKALTAVSSANNVPAFAYCLGWVHIKGEDDSDLFRQRPSSIYPYRLKKDGTESGTSLISVPGNNGSFTYRVVQDASGDAGKRPTPEPAGIVALGVGALGLLLRRRSDG